MEVKVAKGLLSIGAVFLRPEEPFTWASGIKSPIYCDNRLTLTAPEVRDVIEKAIADIPQVQVANYNCPGQIVISGKKESVEQGAEKCKEAGARRAVMLNVSGPFHSDLLKGAGEKLEKVLDSIEINEPQIPYVANVNASYITKQEDIKPLLVKQVSSSVRWQQSVETMVEDGVDTFI